jgi:hypothetical protein
MDWLSSNDIFDLLDSFSEHNMEPASFVRFVEAFGWGNVVAEPIMRTASSYATICCETDYSFSSEDFSWLETIIDVCEAYIDQNRYIVGVELENDCTNYYLACAAIVKILGHVRHGNCLFVFRLTGGIAFGSRRNFSSIETNDFCVSRFIPTPRDGHDNDEEFEEFISELDDIEWDELPQLIIESSPHEKAEKPSNFDRERYDPEYIVFLQEFASMYGVDTSRQADEYTRSFEENGEPIDITYRDAAFILERIGVDTGSSYDILDAANEAEQLSKRLQLTEGTETEGSLSEAADTIIRQYSEEAFEDAELLLKEIMKQSTN